MEIITVRRNRVPVCKIFYRIIVVVIAEIGDIGVFHGAKEGFIVIYLRGGILVFNRIPPESAVDHRCLRPVAVERKEGSVQIRSVLIYTAVGIGSIEYRPAFHKRAVFKDSQRRLRIGQCDGDRHGHGAVRGNNNKIIFKIGHIGMCKRDIRFRHHDGTVLLLRAVRQDNRRDLVVARLVCEIMDIERKGIHAGAFNVITQLHLRALHTIHRDVRLGCRCGIDVHQAGALLARRDGSIAVINDCGSGHQQRINKILRRTRICRQSLCFERLQYNCHATCNMGRGHRGTGHQLIAIAGNSGINIAAGRRNFRLERQLACCTPAGEVTHTSYRRGDQCVLLCNGQVLVALFSKKRAV